MVVHSVFLLNTICIWHIFCSNELYLTKTRARWRAICYLCLIAKIWFRTMISRWFRIMNVLKAFENIIAFFSLYKMQRYIVNSTIWCEKIVVKKNYVMHYISSTHLLPMICKFQRHLIIAFMCYRKSWIRSWHRWRLIKHLAIVIMTLFNLKFDLDSFFSYKWIWGSYSKMFKDN